MLKINPLSTLYVGIDVSSKSNYVCALDFYKISYCFYAQRIMDRPKHFCFGDRLAPADDLSIIRVLLDQLFFFFQSLIMERNDPLPLRVKTFVLFQRFMLLYDPQHFSCDGRGGCQAWRFDPHQVYSFRQNLYRRPPLSGRSP